LRGGGGGVLPAVLGPTIDEKCAKEKRDEAYRVVEVYHGLGLASRWLVEGMNEDIDARGVVLVVYLPGGVVDGESTEEGSGVGCAWVDDEEGHGGERKGTGRGGGGKELGRLCTRSGRTL
jgi:hypothetical protein